MTRLPDLPQRFEIVIRGRLSHRYEAAFDGVTLRTRPGQTVLTTMIIDGPQLYGLLNRLRDLGLELISVNAVGERDHDR